MKHEYYKFIVHQLNTEILPQWKKKKFPLGWVRLGPTEMIRYSIEHVMQILTKLSYKVLLVFLE